MIIISAFDRAKLLADRLGGVFFNINALPDTVCYEKTLIMPCYIYGGFEYKRAVGKIKTVFPNADLLPPLIRNEDDYFEIKSLISASERDILLIHKSRAFDITDTAMWKIGESDNRILEYIKTHGFTKIRLYMLFIGTKFHYENDILPFIKKLESIGIKCEIKMHSIFENEKIINYIIKRTREYEIDGKTEKIAQNTADKGNGEGNICTAAKTYISDFC